MSPKKLWLSDLALLSIACIWGLTFVLVQDAIAILPPFSFLAIRFTGATLLLLPLLRQRTSVARSTYSTRRLIMSGCLLGCLLFAGYALQTFSLLSTTSGKSGFLTGLSVTMVPLLAWLILRTRPGMQALMGVGVATLGLYLLAFVNLSAINPGDLLAFLCAIAFGLQIVYTGKFSAAPVQQLVVIQLGTVALLSTGAALIFEPWHHILSAQILLQPTVLIALLVTALFATALAFLVQTHIQKYTTPTRVALIFAMEPVFAALADFLWNGIDLGPRAFIGCALILSGTLLTEIKIPWLQRLQKAH